MRIDSLITKTNKMDGLNSDAQAFLAYSRLPAEAKVAELAIRLRGFLLPLLLCVPMIWVDALAIGRSPLTDPNPWLVVGVSFYHLIIAYVSISTLLKVVSGFLYVNSYRFRVDDEGIYVLSGVWMRSHQTLPNNRIQNVTVSQTFVQRKLGLMTLFASTISGGISIEHIETEKAQFFREQIIDQINRDGDTTDDD